jgi:subtilisin-like proprotein convertase family protein
MDPTRCDSLTAGPLTTSGSRRVLLNAALASVLSLLGPTAATAMKKHKKHKRTKPTSPPASPPPSASHDPSPTPGPNRGSMTRTFVNSAPIAIPDGGVSGGGDVHGSRSNPYPSPIEVSGFTNGVISNVRVHLNALSHTASGDIDIFLAAAHLPVNAIIMSDAGGNNDANGVNLVLDDAAAADLTVGGTLVSGTFRPANFNPFDNEPIDSFPAPAPSPTGTTQLSVFKGQNPNGTWQLFISDEGENDTGTLAGGWALEITAEADLPAGAASSNSAVAKRRKGKGTSQTTGKARGKRQR